MKKGFNNIITYAQVMSDIMFWILIVLMGLLGVSLIYLGITFFSLRFS
jgi:hypothetical protein